MFKFFKELGEHLGLSEGWGDSDWWKDIDLAIAKVNSVRSIASVGSGDFKSLFTHSLFEIYVRENIEHIGSKAEFDVLAKKFFDIVSEYVDSLKDETS